MIWIFHFSLHFLWRSVAEAREDMASVGALVSKQESTGRKALCNTSADFVDYSIKPEAKTVGPDTSTWPLLLKVLHPRLLSDCVCPNVTELRQTPCQNGPFHSYPKVVTALSCGLTNGSGCSPLRRPLQDYIRYVNSLSLLTRSKTDPTS